MKKLLVYLALLCAVIYFGGNYYRDSRMDQPFIADHTVTLQAQSSHMLGIMTEVTDRSPMGHCTGTAIGPHAILTAEHCNRGKGVRLDYSTHVYTITRVLTDGRDHVIFLLDGPALYNVEPYAARWPVAGETVHMYGNGAEKYPGVYKTGIVLNEYDPSEIDEAAGLAYYSISTIPGDSGTAVYGRDGKIVSVVSYGFEEEGFFYRTHMGGFALNFTPEQIHEAQTYQETQADGLNELTTPTRFNLRNPFNN